MGKAVELREVEIAALKPYERNAKKHSREQVGKIGDSIRRLGFLSPCLIDRDMNVIAGHGRIMAAKAIGWETVPCIFIEGLTAEERKAYILADNRLTELGDWDMDMVQQELADLADADFNISLTGFEVKADFSWFDREEKDGTARQEGNDEYNEFLDKFETKKTTDDCYTPDNVYDAVASWVEKEYGVSRSKFIRPFYPNGDYKKEKYQDGCAVVDNPPFSILSEIIKWYCENGIRFFLFAPTLTLFTAVGTDVTYIPTGIQILYENGASVNTSFITNMDSVRLYISAELFERVNTVNEENERAVHKELPKYSYPDEVVIAARIFTLARYGQSLRVPKNECIYKNRLDSQAAAGKDAFGGLFLLSERAAAERAAAERAAAEQKERQAWKLSEKEWEIIRSIGKDAEA